MSVGRDDQRLVLVAEDRDERCIVIGLECREIDELFELFRRRRFRGVA